MIDELVQVYKTAKSRLLICDYDGVLTPIVSHADRAKPSDELLGLLRDLSVQSGTKLVVISGRDYETLEAWLGDLPIDMSAEHGHFIRESGAWDRDIDVDMSWHSEAEMAMKRLVAQYPGSHIETKHAGLVWHYRQTRRPVDEQAARRLIERVVGGRAVVMQSKCALDIRAHGADKGMAVRYWYGRQKWDFVLCVGDDVTDEAMFAALPSSAWTIKVGAGPTAARHRLGSQAEVIELLHRLVS